MPSESGELFLGGINGFVSFYPDQMEDNPYVPPVVLTSLQQNGVDVDTGQAPEDLKEVTFRWPDNSFEFGFAALNYTLPEKNQHAYKLEGFDSNWNFIGNRRFGRYTNLPGGTYTLQAEGLEQRRGVERGGYVHQGHHRAAFLADVVVLGNRGPGTRWGRLWRLPATGAEPGGAQPELQQQVEERTAELQNEVDQRIQAEEALRQRERESAVAEERNRLARELHDSVTQALYGVTLYSEAAAGHLALGDDERAAEHLSELQDTAQEALAEMRLLVFELRPPIWKNRDWWLPCRPVCRP